MILTAGMPGIAYAQAHGSTSSPTVGTSGNSTSIAGANHDNNAAYNQLIGAGDQIPKAAEHASKPGIAVPATAADIKVGAAIRDNKGVSIGTVVSVDASQAVVDTGQTKIGVPIIAFGKDDRGLLLGMTAEKFNQLVAQAHAKAQASN